MELCLRLQNTSPRSMPPHQPTSINSALHAFRGFVLLHQDDKMILAIPENLELFADTRVIFMDRTFKEPAQLYSQLLSLHAIFPQHFVTFICCLLYDKARQTNHDVFTILKECLCYPHVVSH